MFEHTKKVVRKNSSATAGMDDAVSHITHHADLQRPLSPPFLSNFEDALQEIEYRRTHTNLKQRVEEFLNHDIPEVFQGPEPIFYLARHVATPNYETLRFIELTKDHQYPTVIGQDPQDKFVSNNCLKRALGKMQITKETTRQGDEVVENFTILDFNAFQGKPLASCVTITGENLVDFHNGLLQEIYPSNIILSKETEWIDRNQRGNLYEHYVKYLSLLLVHGITFEDFVEEDVPFISTALVPAIETVTQHFGYKPLICPLIPQDRAFDKNWIGYPSVVYPFVHRKLMQ